LEEYYQLDYEDMIGDLPCKFKYIKVRSDNYGIDSASILGSDEKELNRIVSLKKLRPYRDDQGKVSKKIRGNVSKKKRKRTNSDGNMQQKKKSKSNKNSS